MKKIFTLLAFALSTFSAMATDYRCPLHVTTSGLDSRDTVTVSVTENNGKYNFELKNFVLSMYGQKTGVGTIEVNDIEGTVCGNVTTLALKKNINISAGDDSSIDSWMGPQLGNVPLNMRAEIKGNELNAVLSINMSSTMLVNVTLGSKGEEIGQIPNSGFEEFHNATSSSIEPTSWHSFMSATGDWKSMVKDCVETSDDIRTGSTGKTSLKLISHNATITSANGTITTGRLKAGSTTATDTKNNSFCDLSSTDTDNNGDPFYTVLNTKPDSIKFWVKYKVGAREKKAGVFGIGGYDNTPYIYATASAVITDGTFYQDPEDKTYTNVVAKAANNQIGDTNEEWKEITIPFEYKDSTLTPKAILVTLSTCAEPGGGSRDDDDADEMYIDDMSLVYNAGLKSLTVKGEAKDFAGKKSLSVDAEGLTVTDDDFVVESDGIGAFIDKEVKQSGKNVVANVTITSNDLKTTNTYKLTLKKASLATTAIKNVQTVTTPSGIKAIYNLNGQRVSSMNGKGVFIVEKNDGTTTKVLNK